MKRYRKKPVVIEAIQLTKDNQSRVWEIMTGESKNLNLKDGITIRTLEGDMLASFGDYIIKGINGEYYPCKPDIFEKTYDKVEE